MQYGRKLPYDTLFGADSYRAYEDLVVVIADHGRVKIHPLFLIFTQTITVFVNGIVNNSSLAIIIEEAFCGGLSVCFLNAIFKRLNISKTLNTILTLMYGFSFSVLIFATSSETFIFAGVGLIIYWYIVTYLIGRTGDLSWKEKILLIFFGFFYNRNYNYKLFCIYNWINFDNFK